MNNQRRKAIKEAAARFSEITDSINNLKDELEAIRDEEQEYFDNMPESIQAGEKGERASDALGIFETSISNLEEALDNLSSAESELDAIE